MKNLNVIYRNGHFYNKENEKRIIFKEENSYSIQGYKNSFLLEDPLNEKHKSEEILDADAMKADILNIKELESYALLLPAGTKLQFHLGTLKKAAENQHNYFRFELELLEDLYLYRKKTMKAGNKRLNDCKCVIYKETTGNLQNFEKVYGNSLNNAYSQTCMLYLAARRTSSGSVPNEVSLLGKKKETIGVLRNAVTMVKVQ